MTGSACPKQGEGPDAAPATAAWTECVVLQRLARIEQMVRSVLAKIGDIEPVLDDSRITVAQLCDRYVRFSETYYPDRENSCTTSEAECIEHALRPLRRLCARTPCREFRPRRLREVREAMIRRGWSRGYINQQVGRIKRMFKWAVEHELVAPQVLQALQAVSGLRAGRTPAPERSPVRPVPEELIEPVLAHVSVQVRTMVRLQLLTAMRPGEVCIMRTADVDRSQQPWLYRPSRHKTQHHQHERLVFLGPRAQELIRPFLRSDEPSAFLFSPAEAERERRRRLNEDRRTPLSCGNRPGTKRKRRPRKAPGARYLPQSYGRAIRDACRDAFPIPEGLDADQAAHWRRKHKWHPHQLRHNAATRLRKEFGLDFAQVVLGHKRLEVTQVYAERDVDRARDVMSSVG